jgi:predicted enzyme related to lactoylglutathione lyase
MRPVQVAWGEVTVDCYDTEPVARFWGELLGASVTSQSDGWFRLGPLVAGGPVINFQPVPEPKVGKARLHLDVWVDDLDAGVAFAQELGATALRDAVTEPEGTGVVMADPGGNEFCLIALSAQP